MDEKLDKYIEKRDFNKTSEPKGKTTKSKEGLRFVVQHHIARAEHYDFRLEWEGVLLSWAVPKGPSYDTHDKRLAVKVEDHPIDYRNFEGTIPEGEYGGGTVMLWDEGYCEPIVDVEKGLKKGELKLTLKGKRLKGNWVLIKWKAKSDKKKDNWILIKEKDEYVQDNHSISKYNTSIRTGRTMEEIKEGKDESFPKNPFKKTNVQLATLVDTMPKDKNWIYEVKYDGYRIMAYVENNSVSLMTRNHNDYLNRFSSIGKALLDFAQGRSMVVDGEMVVIDQSGKTDFQALQNYLKHPKDNKITYIIFDILALDGKDLRELPLIERKSILQSLMENAPADLHYSNYVNGEEGAIFKAACESNLEGIIGKKTDSLYNGNRDGSWIKIKCDNREEFVIGGYTVTDIRSIGISALLLGVYDNGEFIYAGRAGTGMSEKDMEILEKKFNSLKRVKSYFKNAPKERTNEEITWVKPDLVAEIKFAEWTKENLLRQASYKGLIKDKRATDVKREKHEIIVKDTSIKEESEKSNERKEDEIIKDKSTVEGIKITHPNKKVYDSPKFTKLDIVNYYEQIAETMLPYISKRILSVVRCPKGISESCFFLKHPVSSSKHITAIPIKESSGEKDDYFYINNKSGIIYEVQMGTLEFHTWGSNIENLENPDIMVFDLDPDEGMDLARVRQGVIDVKSILDELSLKSYLKTSGGKGYHVVVPINPSVTWDTFHEFAKTVAEVMEGKWPDRYTSNVRKQKRKNKIFIDWIRNGRGATSVAPYSVRARKGAKVSMPIEWDELQTIAPDDIDMEEAISRIKSKDPWKDFFENEQMLK